MTRAKALVQLWRDHAALLHRYRDQQHAAWLEDRAEELETALQEQDSELVTLSEAARISGYSPDHLGRLVRKGVIQNYGRPNAPKLKRGDLPRKLALPATHASRKLVGASRRQVAQAILTSGNGR